MNEAATREDIDEVIGILHEFIKQVDDRFNSFDDRFNNFEDRFNNFEIKVEDRFNDQDKKYDRLINTIDGFIGRIDKYETELAARDYQFEKLLTWARKVSDKTGIPLENL